MFIRKWFDNNELKNIVELESNLWQPIRKVLEDQLKIVNSSAEKLKINPSKQNFTEFKTNYDKFHSAVDLVSEKMNKWNEVLTVYNPATDKYIKVKTWDLKNEWFKLTLDWEKVEIQWFNNEFKELKSTEAYSFVNKWNAKNLSEDAVKDIKDFFSEKLWVYVEVTDNMDTIKNSLVWIYKTDKYWYSLVIWGKQLSSIKYNKWDKAKIKYYDEWKIQDVEIDFTESWMLFWKWNRILLQKLLHSDIEYWQLDKFVDLTVMELYSNIKNKLEIDYTVTWSDIKIVNSMIKKDILWLAKWLLDESQLDLYKKLLNDTIFSQEQSKLLYDIATATKTKSWKDNIAAFNKYANIMEWYALIWMKNIIWDSNAVKNIIDVINNSDLTNLAKKQKINALFLKWWIKETLFSWLDIKNIEETTWIKIDSWFIKTPSTDKGNFIKSIVEYKSRNGVYTSKEISLMKENLWKYLDMQEEKFTFMYLQKLDDYIIWNNIEDIKWKANVERNEVDAEIVKTKIDELKQVTDLKDAVRIVDDIKTLDLTYEEASIINWLKNNIDKKTYTTWTDDQLVALSKTIKNISDAFDQVKPNTSMVLKLEDALWWDNPISKSFNKILNPFNRSQVEFPVLQEYVQWKISELLSEKFWDKAILDPIDNIQVWNSQVKELLSEFTSPNLESFVFMWSIKDFKKNTYPKLNELIEWIKNNILTSWEIRIKKDWVVLEWQDVITELFWSKSHITIDWVKIQNWYKNFKTEDLLSLFQNRVTKWYVDWYMIDEFWAFKKFDWIDEYKKYYNLLWEVEVGGVKWELKPILIELDSDSNYLHLLDEENKEIKWYRNRDKYMTQSNLRTYMKFWWTLPTAKWWLKPWSRKEWFFISTNIWEKWNLWLFLQVADDFRIPNWMSFDQFDKKLNEIYFNFLEKFWFDFKWVAVWTDEFNELTDKYSKRLWSSSYAENTLFWSNVKKDIHSFVIKQKTQIEMMWELDEFRLLVEPIKDIIKKAKEKKRDFTKAERKKIIELYDKYDTLTDFWPITKEVEDIKIKFIVESIPTDWASYIMKEQIKSASYIQKHVHEWAPIKMHVWKLWELLFKTLWNPIWDNVEDTWIKELVFKKMFWESKLPKWYKEDLISLTKSWKMIESQREMFNKYPKQDNKTKQFLDEYASIQYVWNESVKIWKKNNWVWWYVEYDKPITINIDWHEYEITWYNKVNTQDYMYTPGEIEVDEMEVWQNIQYRNRIWAIWNDIIVQSVLSEISDAVDTFRKEMDVKVNIDLSNINEIKQNLIEYWNALMWWKDVWKILEAKYDTLLKDISKIISWKRVEWTWLRMELYPNLTRRVKDWDWFKDILLEADQLAIHPKKFEEIKSNLIESNWKFYVIDYRSPIPNKQNVWLKEVVIDEWLEDTIQVVMHPTQVYIQKQADFDWDHLNELFAGSIDWLAWMFQKLFDKWMIDETSLVLKWLFLKKWQKINVELLKEQLRNEIQKALDTNWWASIKQEAIPILDITELEWYKKVVWEAKKRKSEWLERAYYSNLNSISWKDEVWRVDAFIRTFNILSNSIKMIEMYARVFPWKPNPYLKEHNDLVQSINVYTKWWRVDTDLLKIQIKKWKVESPLLPLLTNETKFEQVAAALEQTTLDLAKNKLLDSMPEWWEKIIMIDVLWKEVAQEVPEILSILSINWKQAINMFKDPSKFKYEYKWNRTIWISWIITKAVREPLKEIFWKIKRTWKSYKKTVYQSFWFNSNDSKSMYELVKSQWRNDDIVDMILKTPDIKLDEVFNKMEATERSKVIKEYWISKIKNWSYKFDIEFDNKKWKQKRSIFLSWINSKQDLSIYKNWKYEKYKYNFLPKEIKQKLDVFIEEYDLWDSSKLDKYKAVSEYTWRETIITKDWISYTLW